MGLGYEGLGYGFPKISYTFLGKRVLLEFLGSRAVANRTFGYMAWCLGLRAWGVKTNLGPAQRVCGSIGVQDWCLACTCQDTEVQDMRPTVWPSCRAKH